jgi:hypothetical protein
MVLVYARDEEFSQTHHSLQNLKVICSMFFLGSSPVLDAGDAILDVGE